jgi:hypothetical protein
MMEPMAGSTDSERRAPGDAQPESTLLPAAGPMRCAADPSIETYLRCGRCEKPICPRCLIQTPVGARCRDCAQLRKLPMFDVRPLDYLRAVGGGLAASVGGGLALTFIQMLVPVFGMLNLVFLAALGYGVGTAVALSTRRKQGTALGVLAAFAVPIGLALARGALLMVNGADPLVALSVGFASLIGSAWSLLGLVVAMAIAFSRAR